ncbi:MAG: cell shape-determining protein MreC [Chloroflexota bacterium]|nr:MAG: cell shape-determining protein MreC [Chloroflexota bacterium]
MRTWRSNRLLFLGVCLFVGGALFLTSRAGVLAPVEGIAAAPLNFVAGVFNRLGLGLGQGLEDWSEIESLRQRNADLEEALAQFQSELVELREIASDYRRLADLLEYTTIAQNQRVVAADVIGLDQNPQLRTIVINKGTRDGVALGMPVVTRQGLVGRVQDVSANAARVLLVTDPSSAISGRLQTTRAEGSVIGQLTGNLRMTYIPLDAQVQEGDLVITSGLGGNLPPNIVIGQVTSKRQFEFELFQEAEVRSLIDFSTLEIVLVVTSFQPVDLSVFEGGAGG